MGATVILEILDLYKTAAHCPLLASGDGETANLLRGVDDSCVVAKLQRSDDGGGQREQQVAGYLLALLPAWATVDQVDRQERRTHERGGEERGGGQDETWLLVWIHDAEKQSVKCWVCLSAL